jgi:hypothetical protein
VADNQRGEDELSVEMTGFTYGVRVDPFAYEELPFVYEKYRNRYNLSTDYEDIPAQVKRLLRDPLTLLLVAETYRDDTIPIDIRSSEMIKEYVKKLIVTERIYQRDLDFLRNEIVPRIFQPPFFQRLLPSDIEGELTTTGHQLSELIFNDDPLPGGRRVNQSYTNLADSVILVDQEAQSELTVGFTYERFYEYFGGLHLCETAYETNDPFSYYRDISDSLATKPYLWGVLKNAFFNELKNGNTQLLHQLAKSISSDDRLLRSAIVYSIVEYNEVDSEAVSKLVHNMIQPLYGPAHNIIEVAKRILFRKRYENKLLNIEQAIAIEIAGQLGFENLLAQAAVDRVGTVRQTAILHIFYLWRKDAEAGYRIIKQLNEYTVTNWDLPDPGAIDALISLIISIITFDHLNSEVQKHALQAGRQILRKLLLLNPEEHSTVIGRIRRFLADQIRQPLLSLGINWVLKIIISWGQEDLPANIKTLSTFFALSESEKDLTTPLIPYFNPFKPGLYGLVNEIKAGEETGDFVLMNIVGAPIIARAQTNSDDGIATLRELVTQRLSEFPPKPWIEGYLWTALQIALRQHPHPDPDILNLGEQCAIAIQGDPYAWLKTHNELMSVPFLWNTSGIGNFMVLTYHCTGQSISPIVQKWIMRAIDQEDIEYLFNFVTKELTLAFDMGFHKVTLDGLKLVAHHPDQRVKNAITESLIRIRRYFPAEVEDILLQEVFPDEINQKVWISSSSERVNDLLGFRAVGILYDLFLLGPEVLRQETIWLADQARKMSNLESWITLITKEVLNLVANETIFPAPKDSPSKLLLEK